MARNGSGVYSLPAGYEAVTGETILATQHNTPLEDLQSDANAARPVVAGGTGATTAAGARDNLAAQPAVKGADIASATTVDLSAATGNVVDITGTTTITGLGTVDAGKEFTLQFDGALTFTHNATSLKLPGGANITTAAGDIAVVVSEGSGNWRCVSYQRANVAPSQLDTVKKLTSGTISSAVTVPLVLTSYLALGYTKFRLHLIDVAPATDSTYLVMDISTNGGASYLNSAYNNPCLSFIVGTVVAYNSSSQSSFVLTDSTGNAAGEVAHATVDIDIYSTSVAVRSRGSHITPTGATRGLLMEGFRVASGVNAVRFYQTSGNMASGSYELYGVK